MDADTASRARGSTRACLPRPVARASAGAILDAAHVAPGASDIPPWPVHVVAGAAMQAQQRRNDESFDAPAGPSFLIDSDPGPGSWLEYGMFLQSIMPAAVPRGLATCPQASRAPLHPLARAPLPVAGSQLRICGMGLGYADLDAPINRFRAGRPAVGELTHRHGLGANA